MEETTNKEKIFNRRPVFFCVMVFLMFLVLAALILNIQNKTGGVNKSSGWTPVMMRKYAGKLRSEGLFKQASAAYEEYLVKAGVDNRIRANIYYTIGTMLMEEKNYEDALAYFYKSEIAYPDGPLKKDIGINIVAALENMGKSLDAEYALEEHAALSKKEVKKKPHGEIIAKIGKREITMGEVNDAIEKLPPWLGEQYKKDELKKLEFLRQYVFTELLYDKGKKLQYDKSVEVRGGVKDALKQLVVGKVVEDEIKNKVKAEPSDMKLYYEANKEKYVEEKSKRQKDFEEVKAQVESEYRREKERILTDALFREMLKSKDVQIYDWKFGPKKKDAGGKEK